MLGRYIRNKFGKKHKEVPSAEEFHTPLRIALHSTVDIQTVDMLVLKSSLNSGFVIPQGSMEVLAIGTFSLDGTPVHQVYLKDMPGEEFILQIVEGKDYRTQEPTVDELTLYKQCVTLEPETQASLDRYLADIGFADLTLNEVVYERMWGDEYTEKANFRKFSENVITPAGPETFTDEYLLYGRECENPVGDEPITEYLLVGIEEGNSNAQIMMQVGLKLNPSDVTVQ